MPYAIKTVEQYNGSRITSIEDDDGTWTLILQTSALEEQSAIMRGMHKY